MTTGPINITCPKCASSAGDPCRDRYARTKPTCRERTAAAAKSRAPIAGPVPVPQPAPKPDDFDESTPPPKTRPRGTPLPIEVTLPPGEDLVGIFGQWNKEGRIPAGAILCEHRGVSAPLGGGPQHKVLAGTAGADLDGFKVAVWISRQPSPMRKWCVMVPVKGGVA